MSPSGTDPGFKGRGFAFPPSFARGGAGVAMVDGDEDIAQSLGIILSTRPGERVMQPAFGCALDDFAFEEIDQGLINRLTRIVSDAILYHEPRVELLGVAVNASDVLTGRVDIEIRYCSRVTNSRFNMVWPFYLREAVRDPGSAGGHGV